MNMFNMGPAVTEVPHEYGHKIVFNDDRKVSDIYIRFPPKIRCVVYY
jgi:hypothetical protein